MPQPRPGAQSRRTCIICAGGKTASLSCAICACEEREVLQQEAYCSVECYRSHFSSVHYVSGGAPFISQIVDRGSSRSESSISTSSTSSRRCAPVPCLQYRSLAHHIARDLLWIPFAFTPVNLWSFTLYHEKSHLITLLPVCTCLRVCGMLVRDGTEDTKRATKRPWRAGTCAIVYVSTNIFVFRVQEFSVSGHQPNGQSCQCKHLHCEARVVSASSCFAACNPTTRDVD